MQTPAIETMMCCSHETPIGVLTLAADHVGLRHIVFPAGTTSGRASEDWIETPQAFDQLRRELDEYFSGRRQTFSVALAPQGTEFQQTVWTELTSIAYASTVSYADVAQAIGRPKASRAVGAANGANPLPLLIPCHRVIGSTGKLTGFGGGLATKQWLLAHERGERSLFPFTSPADDEKNQA